MKREMRYLLWMGLSVGGAGFFLFCFWRRRGKRTRAISGKYNQLTDIEDNRIQDESCLYSTQNKEEGQIKSNVRYQLIVEEEEVTTPDSLSKTEENDCQIESGTDPKWPKQRKHEDDEDTLHQTYNDRQTESEEDLAWPKHQRPDVRIHIEEDTLGQSYNGRQNESEEDLSWPKHQRPDVRIHIEEDSLSKTEKENDYQFESEKDPKGPKRQKLDDDKDSFFNIDEVDYQTGSGKDNTCPKPQTPDIDKDIDTDSFSNTDTKNDYQIGSGKDIAWLKQQKPDLDTDEDLLLDVRKIRSTIFTNLPTDKEQKFDFMIKLMAVNVTARNFNIHEMTLQSEDMEDTGLCNDTDMSPNAANPLDVMCEIMQDSCKNYIFRQDIISKMSMCQFSIPLLLPPAGGTPHCTFLLWPMRDIIKRWRPQSIGHVKGYREDNLVNIGMPVHSFVRLGSCSLSKSKLLNYVLSPLQQTHNFFVHHDMDGGNIRKKSSEGLVEISWYFPSGQKGIDVFGEPIAVTNLRGDLEAHNQQLQFLLSISSAMFIFVESINEKQYNLLSGLSEKKDICYFFIINGRNIKPGDETTIYLNRLLEKLNLKKMNVIIKNKTVTDTQIVLKLQAAIKSLNVNSSRKLSLQEIAAMEIWNKFNIAVDEDLQICESAKRKSKEITNQIQDIAQYKKEVMKLHGEPWRKLTKLEKELCKLRELGNRDPEEYKSELQAGIHQLRVEQRHQPMADSVQRFIDTMIVSSSAEKQLFIKWLKMYLDEAGRSNLSALQAEYREKQNDLMVNAEELKNIDQRIANSSLGVEHFLRELGQFYEAAKYMKERGHSNDETHSKLPKIASDLLLDGFSLELIDGDTSNIPLQWITDVLKEMDVKTGGQCRMRVITVLGVQSTGKSTLLNTMFGLQLPVASGRCTRGAFMTVISVEKEFQKDLGCQYILVIDTEGLKSLELASLDGSYEHDNELATVVVGLSDVTIVNMAMENTEEIKYILQIIVHAFLRMKEIGNKPSCQFVYQNVSDVSAHVKNQRARQKFLEQLNELTRIAAKMEKRSGIASFSDIIYCDLEKHSWYIPGRWYGTPPMASINIGYSESIQELKKSIFEYLKSMPGKSQTINEFTEWVKSLWNAVKHEKFIFSFRNRLVTEAYNELCVEYSDWEWRFQKNAHHWMIKTETLIYNLSSDKLGLETWNKIMDEMYQLLYKEERNMSQSLENYFEHDLGNAHLLDMFRGDFFRSVNFLRKGLENTLVATFEKTMRIQREKCEIQTMQEQYINVIEAKVGEIIETKTRDRSAMSLEQLKSEFETMWQKTLSTLQLSKLERQNIEQIIIQQLEQDMKYDEQALNRLYNLTSLSAYTKKFEVNQAHYDGRSNNEIMLIQNVASSLLHKCNNYVSKCANTRENFNKILSQELLEIINRTLSSQNVRYLGIPNEFKLDLKLHILGNAALTFQRMHNDFVQRNDPGSRLEMLKPEYFATFQNVFEKRNECQRRAEQFCELCLKPAIIDHINRRLGQEILEEILQKGESISQFKSHTLFQSVLLEELLQKKLCEEYANYINDYETFVKEWISQYILQHYNGQGDIQTLQLDILESLDRKIIQTLKNLQVSDVAEFVLKFCNILKKDLIISQNNLKVVAFQSAVDIGKFIRDIEAYLPDLQKQLQVEIKSASLISVLSQLNLKPQKELAKKMVGCGKQCPFCKAPCEAGGADHKEHFASLHRPRGLAQHRDEQTEALDHSICSTNIISNKSFSNADTNWEPHPYKDYQTIYPDWAIYPDTTGNSSDYWKFVFTQFNKSFAEMFGAKPANLPKDWHKITEGQALKSLKTTLKHS